MKPFSIEVAITLPPACTAIHGVLFGLGGADFQTGRLQLAVEHLAGVAESDADLVLRADAGLLLARALAFAQRQEDAGKVMLVAPGGVCDGGAHGGHHRSVQRPSVMSLRASPALPAADQQRPPDLMVGVPARRPLHDANGLALGPPDADMDAGLVERIAAGEATHEEVMASPATVRVKKGMGHRPSPESRPKRRALTSRQEKTSASMTL